MSCEEAEAPGLLAKKHSSEVSVPEADLSLVCNRTGYAEGLKALSYLFRSLGSRSGSGFQSRSGTERICPDSILKCYSLNSLDYLFNIYPPGKAESFSFFKIT